MNKKFLSVVLFGALMAGSSVTFTGCIDNDEPAGIENLRGAKAELLRAKVAVEAAEAAYKNAQATEMLAQARRMEALALQAELEAKEKELDNALLEAQNAELIARAEAAVVEAQKDLENNKLALEEAKLKNAAALAQAQKDYEDAMKAIELSKNYLSDAELAVLADVQGELKAAKDQIYGGYFTYKEYVTDGSGTHHDDGGSYKLVTAHFMGSKDMMDNAYEAYQNAAIDPGNYIDKATLESDLVNSQARLDFYNAKLNLNLEALATLKDGDAYQAWLKLKKDYEAKRDSLGTVIAAKNSQANKIIAEQTPAIDALAKAIKDARDVKASSATDKDSVYTVSNAIASNLDAQASKFTGFVGYADGKVTANFKSYAGVLALAEAKSDDDKTSAIGYETLLNNSFAFADGNGSKYKAAVTNISDAIKAVNDAKAAIDANEMAYAKEVQADAKKAMDEQKKVADAAIKVWNDAVTAYNSGTSYTRTEYDEAYGGIQILLNAVKNGTPGYTTDAQIKNVYDKYISFRAVMTANGQKELPDMPKDITDGKTLKTYLESINDVKDLLPAGYTEVDLKANLLAAAKAAFGTAGIYNDGKEERGVLVKPTDEAIKKIENFGNTCGAQGLYLANVDAYNTATENVEKVAQFDKVIAQLTSWKASLAVAKDAYMTKNKATLDAVTTAQKVVTDKVATPITALGLDKDWKLLGEIEAVLEFSVDGDYASNNNTIIAYVKELISKLEKTIGHKEGTVNPEDGTYYTDTTGLYASIKIAETDVFKAKKMLELYNSGDLKAQYLVDTKKEAYEAAKEAYERDLEQFNYWNGKLSELMKTLYGNSSAE